MGESTLDMQPSFLDAIIGGKARKIGNIGDEDEEIGSSGYPSLLPSSHTMDKELWGRPRIRL